LISQYKNEKVLVEQSQFEIKIPQDDGDFISTGITSKNIEEVYIVFDNL